jgi:hypothetical protein
MMAYVVGGAFSYIDPVDIGWRYEKLKFYSMSYFFRLMFAFAAVPSIIQFIGFWFLPQSPRFAFEKEGVEACEKVGGDQIWQYTIFNFSGFRKNL